MNHPKREEWAPYLFGETKIEVRRELNAHLKECADCRQEIENWQRSLARLDAWKLQSVPKPGLNFAPYLNWAAAAALLLLLGFGIGRLTAKADVDKVRAANALIAQFARKERRVEYIDVFSHMLGPDGVPRPDIFVADRLHMNERGYALWTDIIRRRL